MVRHTLRLLGSCVAALFVIMTATAAAQSAPRRPPTPINPVDAIIDAFRTHTLVGLGESTHGGVADHALRLAVLRDPRLPKVVNDLVVEWGNARYQPLMDRFVSGEPIPDAELRQVWENTTPWDSVFDGPVYGEWFHEVRRINAGLPAARRFRVLLADPPVDWAEIRTGADLPGWDDQREPFSLALVQREVLAKGRRALLLFGSGHLQRKNERRNFQTADFLVGLLERDGQDRVFTIRSVGRSDPGTLEPLMRDWPVPSLAVLAGTTMGARDVSAFYTTGPRMEVREGVRVMLTPDQYRPMAMEEQFDAIVWLGPPSALTIARITADQCANQQFMDMRLGRMALMLDMPGGGAEAEAAMNRLKRYCAMQAVK